MTDYQNELVMEHLDLVNWVIRTRISVPNRPLLTYDDFYAIGCEAICRAALKYQADSGEFAPFACRYIYNAIIDHCRAMNYRLQRSVDAGFEEGEVDADASDAVFSYVVCCVCPVKERKVELGFFPGDNEFHSCAGQIVAAPELGFLFPAFDDRAANIYNALFYSRKTDEIHQEVIDSVFHTTAPMSAAEQKKAFQNALSEALGDACNMELVQSIHDRLRDQIEQHKEIHDPEPLELSVSDAAAILRDNGVEEEKILAFRDNCFAQFGDGATLNPANLIDSSRFEVKTADATISLDPEHSYLVETRIIDGRKYLLIPADEDIEVNGFGVRVKGE